MREIQFSISRNFANFDKRIQVVQHGHIPVTKTDAIGTTHAQLPLDVALVGIANRAQDYLDATVISDYLAREADDTSSNVLGGIRVALIKLVDECGEIFLKNVRLQRWTLIGLISFAVLAMVVVSVMISLLMLSIINQNQTALASFAFISQADINKSTFEV